MKVRNSGMPEEERWSDFFEPEAVLRVFGLNHGVENLVDFGCGYGTFTIAAAKLIPGIVHALDIEPEMIEIGGAKCRQEGLAKIHWNHDPMTPRGPSLEIRPRPDQCVGWGKEAGFTFAEDERFDLRPYHYGLLFRKPGPSGSRA